MISPKAVVQTDQLGKDCSIAEFAVVRPGVAIGNGVIIHPHVVIEAGAEIGDGVEIFPGAYIGKEPKGAGATARIPEFERRIVIGANSSIGPHSVVFQDVRIGTNTLLGDGASIRRNAVSVHTASSAVTSRSTTTLGSVIGPRSWISHT